MFLIGNKADLEENRVIHKEQAEKYKEEYDLDYFIETSAKTGMNAQEIFIEAAKTLYNDYSLYKNEKKPKENNNTNTTSNSKLVKTKENSKKKKQCC